MDQTILSPLYKKFRLACENDDVPLFIEYMTEVDKWGHILYNLHKAIYYDWRYTRVCTFDLRHHHTHQIKIHKILSDVIKFGSIKICQYLVQTYDPRLKTQIISQNEVDDNSYSNVFKLFIIPNITKSPNGILFITEIFNNFPYVDIYDDLLYNACRDNNHPIIEYILTNYLDKFNMRDRNDLVIKCVLYNYASLLDRLILLFKLNSDDIKMVILRAIVYNNIQVLKKFIPNCVHDINKHDINQYVVFAYKNSKYLSLRILLEYAKANDLLHCINWVEIANTDDHLISLNSYNSNQNTVRVLIEYGAPYKENLTLITIPLFLTILRYGELSLITHVIINTPINQITHTFLQESARNTDIDVYEYIKSLYRDTITDEQLNDIGNALSSQGHYDYLMQHPEYIVDACSMLQSHLSQNASEEFIKWLLETYHIDINQSYIALLEQSFTYPTNNNFDIIIEHVKNRLSKEQIKTIIIRHYSDTRITIRFIRSILSMNYQPSITTYARFARYLISHNNVDLLMQILPHLHKHMIRLMQFAYNVYSYECLDAMCQYIVANQNNATNQI